MIVCLPLIHIALADGMNRFWKYPGKAPCDAAPSPIDIATGGPTLLSSDIAQHVRDRDARETVEPNVLMVEAGRKRRFRVHASGKLRRRKRLLNCAVSFLPNKAENLGRAQIRLNICVFVIVATWLPASRCCVNPATLEYP